MINQEFLSQCTDEQINKGVAWLVTKSDPSKFGAAFLHGVIVLDEFYPTKYCTRPNDAWPIILENKISIIDWLDGWEAFENKAIGAKSYNTNPLRAICEVYILMSVSK